MAGFANPSEAAIQVEAEIQVGSEAEIQVGRGLIQ